MNNFKRRYILIAIFLMIASVIFGQDAQNREERPSAEERSESTIELLANELGLSNEQKNQCEPVYADYYRDLDVVIEEDLSKFKLMREIKSLQKVRDSELEKILTPAQFKEFEEIQEEIKKKMKESGN